MDNQLDEDLAGKVIKPPFGRTLFKGFLVYFTLLIVGFVVYYAIVESFNSILPDYKLLNNVIITLILGLVFVNAGYFFQKIIFPLFDPSIAKTTLVPTLFWFFLIVVSFLGNFAEGGAIKAIQEVSFLFTIIFIWIGSLSLIISWFIKEQKFLVFLVLFLIHWMFSNLAGLFYHYYFLQEKLQLPAAF